MNLKKAVCLVNKADWDSIEYLFSAPDDTLIFSDEEAANGEAHNHPDKVVVSYEALENRITWDTQQDS